MIAILQPYLYYFSNNKQTKDQKMNKTKLEFSKMSQFVHAFVWYKKNKMDKESKEILKEIEKELKNKNRDKTA